VRDPSRLDVWIEARRLVPAIYRLTAGFPDSERFGLVPQMRRASVSIVANIAEGCGRGSEGEFRRFLCIASGSAAELASLVLVCRDLGFLGSGSDDECELDIRRLRRKLTSLINTIGFSRQ